VFRVGWGRLWSSATRSRGVGRFIDVEGGILEGGRGGRGPAEAAIQAGWGGEEGREHRRQQAVRSETLVGD
jgi:hypothetical protein